MGKGARNRTKSMLNISSARQQQKQAQEPLITSFLDCMKDGMEYASVAGIKNSNVDLGSEIKKSIAEIESIRNRPLICYVANVLNPKINDISIDNSDDKPFLEMLSNVSTSQNELDIMLVTPGGSAETVDYFVKQIRARFKHVSFILPYMSMSAGTIFCMSGDELIMDEDAFFGPIDPQVPSHEGRFVPAQSVLTLLATIQKRGEERLTKGINPDWSDILILRELDAKEIGNAINASKLSTDLVSHYLECYKFKNWIYHDNDPTKPVSQQERHDRANEIANKLCDHSLWLSHSSRISREMAVSDCKLKVMYPENINGLRRGIKRFWALMCITLENTSIKKVFASSNYIIFRLQPKE